VARYKTSRRIKKRTRVGRPFNSLLKTRGYTTIATQEVRKMEGYLIHDGDSQIPSPITTPGGDAEVPSTRRVRPIGKGDNWNWPIYQVAGGTATRKKMVVVRRPIQAAPKKSQVFVVTARNNAKQMGARRRGNL